MFKKVLIEMVFGYLSAYRPHKRWITTDSRGTDSDSDRVEFYLSNGSIMTLLVINVANNDKSIEIYPDLMTEIKEPLAEFFEGIGFSVVRR
jgi:hypothetical protein